MIRFFSLNIRFRTTSLTALFVTLFPCYLTLSNLVALYGQSSPSILNPSWPGLAITCRCTRERIASSSTAANSLPERDRRRRDGDREKWRAWPCGRRGFGLWFFRNSVLPSSRRDSPRRPAFQYDGGISASQFPPLPAPPEARCASVSLRLLRGTCTSEEQGRRSLTTCLPGDFPSCSC